MLYYPVPSGPPMLDGRQLKLEAEVRRFRTKDKSALNAKQLESYNLPQD